MSASNSVSPFIVGAIAGAVICAIAGFSTGFVVTEGTAEKQAAQAVQDAMIPVCAESFMNDAEAVAEFNNTSSSFQQRRIVQKAVPKVGDISMTSSIANACAKQVKKDLAKRDTS